MEAKASDMAASKTWSHRQYSYISECGSAGAELAPEESRSQGNQNWICAYSVHTRPGKCNRALRESKLTTSNAKMASKYMLRLAQADLGPGWGKTGFYLVELVLGTTQGEVI
jgi:hypothetical protein